jgi:hypothetical protein
MDTPLLLAFSASEVHFTYPRQRGDVLATEWAQIDQITEVII